MSVSPQKELTNGEVWYQPGEKVPNVSQKLFALQNLLGFYQFRLPLCPVSP